MLRVAATCEGGGWKVYISDREESALEQILIHRIQMCTEIQRDSIAVARATDQGGSRSEGTNYTAAQREGGKKQQLKEQEIIAIHNYIRINIMNFPHI